MDGQVVDRAQGNSTLHKQGMAQGQGGQGRFGPGLPPSGEPSSNPKRLISVGYPRW